MQRPRVPNRPHDRPGPAAARTVTVAAALALTFSAGVLTPRVAGATDHWQRVRFDTLTEQVVGRLPHGRDFLLEVEIPDSFRSATLTYWRQDDGVCAPKPPKRAARLPMSRPPARLLANRFLAAVPPLAFSAGYCVHIDARQAWEARDERRVTEALGATLDSIVDGQPSATWRKVLARGLGVVGDRTIIDDGKPGDVTLVDFLTAVARQGDEARTLSAQRATAERQRAAVARGLRAFAAVPGQADLDAAFGGQTPPDVSGELRWLATQQAVAAELARGLGRGAQLDAAARKAIAATLRGARARTERMAAAYCVPEQIAKLFAPVGRARSRWCAQPAAATKALQQADRAAAEASKASAAAQAARKRWVSRAAATAETLGTLIAAPVVLRTGKPALTRQGAPYTSVDLGLAAVMWGGERGVDPQSHVAISFAFAPADKRVPLALDDGAGKRLSIVVGMGLDSVQTADGRVGGVVGSRGLLAGLGVRLSDDLRLGAGAVCGRIKQPNADGERPLRFAPYLSLSLDLDVLGFVRESRRPR